MISKEPIIHSQVEELIRYIRGQRVMLDADLAKLYQVETRILTRAVGRNIERFPTDFMFRLEDQEVTNLRSQIGISSFSHGGRRYGIYAFSEQGVAMLSTVLRSQRAIRVNIEIMRAFVRFRGILNSHRDLSLKLDQLEQRYDHQFKVVFDAIKEIMTPQISVRKQKMGFRRTDEA